MAETMIRSAVCLGILATIAIGPGCGLKKRHRCTASTSYLGKTRSGRGDDFDSQEKAKELARGDVCPSYCSTDDPDVETAYQKARDPSKPDDHVGRINVINNPPVKAVLDACKARCDGALAGASFAYECEHSGI